MPRLTLLPRHELAIVPDAEGEVGEEAGAFLLAFREIDHDASRGSQLNIALDVGSIGENVTVTASNSSVQVESPQVEREAGRNAAPADIAASGNVTNLQRPVAGVLPIAVDVPRTGSSHRFVHPLVVDEETTLSFSYRSLR
jgi:hypothetical protein